MSASALGKVPQAPLAAGTLSPSPTPQCHPSRPLPQHLVWDTAPESPSSALAPGRSFTALCRLVRREGHISSVSTPQPLPQAGTTRPPGALGSECRLDTTAEWRRREEKRLVQSLQTRVAQRRKLGSSLLNAPPSPSWTVSPDKTRPGPGRAQRSVLGSPLPPHAVLRTWGSPCGQLSREESRSLHRQARLGPYVRRPHKQCEYKAPGQARTLEESPTHNHRHMHERAGGQVLGTSPQSHFPVPT